MTDRFQHHITEAKKDTAVFAFGRMNPPTTGHGVVVNKIIEEASKRNADHFVFVSVTQDAAKNPLTHEQKVSYLKKFFPKGNFPLNKAKDPYGAVLYLCEQGYKHIYMVAGSDQVQNFKSIGTYKGKVALRDPQKRTYSFDTFEVIQAGASRVEKTTVEEIRKMLAKGEEVNPMYMSASLMRTAAFENDFDVFLQGVPGKNKTLAKKLYKDLHKGLGIKEDYNITESSEDHDKVTILALTSSQKDLSDTIEKMQEICKKRKIEFYAVKASKAQLDISDVASKKIVIKNYDGEGKTISIVPGNTVAIVRGGVMNTDIGVAIMTILQNNGVFMINERGGMELCANKLETAIALKKHNLPHPRTAFVADESNIETAVKDIGSKFPVIVKTLTGAEGIGVSKIDSMESLKSVLQTLWKYGAEVIMQEFLPDFKNDVRSICLNGKIFACAKRDKAPKDFRTNIARGSKGGAFQLSKEEIELVEQAARVSKCYYVGVDHVINQGKPYIIEMNASPGSGNIYYRYYEDGKGKNNVKGEELVEDFVDYIINKAHWKLFSNLAVRENVKIDGVEYNAKIDTGNSGYNMIHGEEIKDNKDHTVTFKLPSGKKVTKKIVSRITVKSGIGSKQRLVVLMDIEFHGKKYPNIKFSIGDRSHMSTKVLLGLQFLSKTGMMVDPAEAIYPSSPKNSKNTGDEEEEEELTEKASAKEAINAVIYILKSPAISGKLISLAKKRKTIPDTQFKKEFESVKKDIILKSYKVSGASGTIGSFVHENKLGALLTKILDKFILSGIEPSGIINKIVSAIMPHSHLLSMSNTIPEVVEADTKSLMKDTTFKTFKRLVKGKLKSIKNGYEHDDVLQRIESIDESKESINGKIRLAIAYEERCHTRNMKIAEELTRSYIELLKEVRNQEIGGDDTQPNINENFDFLMLEVSPPSGPARRFSKKEKIKKEFQKRYGKRWKDVFYATAWKMHGGESFEPTQEWLDESKKINSTMQWTALGKRGPLLIGTDKIANTYRQDTPGERERLKEETPKQKTEDEKNDIYKEWSKLVNMSSKELSNFIDSDEGKEAGLSRKESGKAGSGGGKITSGRDSARAIVRMLDRSKDNWKDNDWKWAGKQVNFINRMKGAKGAFRESDGKPTRKLLALKIWGHNPEKK